MLTVKNKKIEHFELCTGATTNRGWGMELGNISCK